MTKIVLKKMKIKNFKGTSSREIEFDGDTVIEGANRSGKSTIFDAYVWCLFGFNSNYETNLLFKPYDEKNNVTPHLENEVELTFDVEGKKKVFLRVNKEKWTKPRNQTEKILTGHDIDYYVDGYPVKATEYSAEVSSLFNADVFKTLSDVSYFNIMNWKDAREVLISMTDIMSDNELIELLIERDGSYSLIKDFIVNGKNINQEKLRLNTEIKKLEKDRTDIPVRIDELKAMKKDDIDASGIKKKIVLLKEELRLVEVAERSVLESYKKEKKKYDSVREEIRSYEKKITEREAELKKGDKAEEDKLNAEISELDSVIREEKKKLDAQSDHVTHKKDQLIKLQEKLPALRKEYASINSEEFDLNADKLSCPTCKREYDNSEDIKTELEEEFNKSKALRLDKNKNEGLNTVDSIKTLEDEISKSEEIVVQIISKLEKLKEERLSINVNTADRDTSCDEIIAGYELKISELEKSLEKAPVAEESDHTKKKKEIESQIYELRLELQKEDKNNEIDQKINEYLIKVKEISSLVGDCERKLSYITSFEKEKMMLTENAVNSKFENIRFKLWDYHLNGNDDPKCECLVDGVPYKSVNTAGKVNAGIQIIKALQKHYNVYPPLFIDNRESVTEIIDIPCQVINLRVNPEVKQLRIIK